MSGVRGLTVAYYGSSYIQVNDSSKTGGVLPSGIFTEYVYGGDKYIYEKNSSKK